MVCLCYLGVRQLRGMSERRKTCAKKPIVLGERSELTWMAIKHFCACSNGDGSDQFATLIPV